MNNSWTSGGPFGGNSGYGLGQQSQQPAYGLSNQQTPAWASRGLNAYGFGGQPQGSPQGMTGGLFGLGQSMGGAFGQRQAALNPQTGLPTPTNYAQPGQTPAGYDDWAQSQGFGDDEFGQHKRQWAQQQAGQQDQQIADSQARLAQMMPAWQQQAKDNPAMWAFDPNKGLQSILAMPKDDRANLPGWQHLSYYQDPTTGATADASDLAQAQGQGTAVNWTPGITPNAAPGQPNGQRMGGMDPGAAFAPAMGQQTGGMDPGYGLSGLGQPRPNGMAPMAQLTGGMDPGAAFIRR